MILIKWQSFSTIFSLGILVSQRKIQEGLNSLITSDSDYGEDIVEPKGIKRRVDAIYLSIKDERACEAPI